MLRVLLLGSLFYFSASVRSNENSNSSAPVIFANSSEPIVTVLEKATAILECYAGGNPTPRVSWRLSSNTSLPTLGSTYEGNVYKIENIKREAQVGSYICTAENGIGEKATRMVHLKVKFSPDVYIRKSEMYEAVGYDIYFYCFVLAYPWPKVSWTKNEQPVTNDSHITVIKSTSGTYYTTLSINIKNIQDGDFGKYKCKAENELGSEEVETKLQKAEKHECPPVCADPPVILNYTDITGMSMVGSPFSGSPPSSLPHHMYH